MTQLNCPRCQESLERREPFCKCYQPMHTVFMPGLGESVSQGYILRWLRREGETVKEGEPLLEIETEKVNIEIPAPVGGVLYRVLAEEGELISVGDCLAYIGEPDGPLPNPPLRLQSTKVGRTTYTHEQRFHSAFARFLRGLLLLTATMIMFPLLSGQAWFALAFIIAGAVLFVVFILCVKH